MREVKELIQPSMVIEGAGVRLLRAFAPSIANPLDPFLLFDHFAFNDPIEGPIAGFPNHPHRGIETVTYMLEGNVRHRDSLGNAGVIGPGSVQWMTSGRGIMHEEMPQRSKNGVVCGFQLWVNLPAAKKMSQPHYQEIRADAIPSIERDGADIRLIAGEMEGLRGPVTEIAAQPVYLDVSLQTGASFTIDLPYEHTAAAYLFEGSIAVQSERIDALTMVIFSKGDQIQIHADPDKTGRFILMAGAPFGEPIVPYGPFVMNTRAEIMQALDDLRNGTFVS